MVAEPKLLNINHMASHWNQVIHPDFKHFWLRNSSLNSKLRVIGILPDVSGDASIFSRAGGQRTAYVILHEPLRFALLSLQYVFSPFIASSDLLPGSLTGFSWSHWWTKCAESLPPALVLLLVSFLTFASSTDPSGQVKDTSHRNTLAKF